MTHNDEIKIVINKPIAEWTLENYQAIEQRLILEIQEKQNNLDAIQKVSAELVRQIRAFANYDPGASRWEKVEFALRKLQKASSIAEIIEELKKYEPTIDSAPSPFHASLATKLDVFIKTGSKETGDLKYSLKER